MITLNINGQEYQFPDNTRYGKIAEDFQESVNEDILLIRENNRLREFHHKAADGSSIRFITGRDTDGRKAYLRTLLLVLNCSLSKMIPAPGGRKKDHRYDLQVYFSFGDGMYCSLADPTVVTQELLDRLTQKMEEMVGQALPVTKRTVDTSWARDMFREREMYDKEQLFRYRLSSSTNLYSLDGYEDYYYGYMLANTRLLKTFSLVKYDDGFVLRYPYPGKGEESAPFVPKEKLFQVQRSSFRWGQKIGIQDVGDLNDWVVKKGAAGLILTQEAYHEAQIARIAQQIASDPEKRIILIAGPSSSGKTTFSHRLSTQLSVHGIRPHPIPVDDYFVNRENTPKDENGNYNFEVLEAIDVELFNRDMQGLLAGEEVSMPTFNFRSGKREYKGNTLKIEKGDVLVIEGIHGLNERLTYSLPRESIFRVYISALTQLSVDGNNNIPTTDGRMIRRIVRDARTRGTSAENTIAMWPSVRRGEEEHIFPHQDKADVMFNSALIYELAVLKIYAEPLLFGIQSDSPYYPEANRLLKFLTYFVPIAPETIPNNSLLREFIGGSCFDV